MNRKEKEQIISRFKLSVRRIIRDKSNACENQQDVGKKIGLSKHSMSKLMNGDSIPTSTHLHSLHKQFKVSPSFILIGVNC